MGQTDVTLDSFIKTCCRTLSLEVLIVGPVLNAVEFTRSNRSHLTCRLQSSPQKHPDMLDSAREEKFNAALDFYTCKMCVLFDVRWPLTEKSLKRGYWKTFHFLSW